MNLKELKDIRDNIINEYKSGICIDELCKKHNAKWSDVYNIISPLLRHSKKAISEFEKYRIKEMYQNGLSSTKIGVELNIYHKTVNSILDDFGIKRKHNGKRKYTLNEHYFDKIDTPNKAYILGLLYADGYNSIGRQTVRLQLQESDYEILEKIRTEINSNKPLKFIRCDNKIPSNGYISKNMYQLEFYGKYICESLDKLGMHQNKSLILTFPTFLKEELYSHFIRGYFDGDGSYCYRQDPYYGERDMVTLTSTDAFCKDAKKIINTYSHAIGGGIYDSSSHNGITKVLCFSGKNQVNNLLNWFYQDAELYIQRKYDLYFKRFIA